MHLFTLSQDNLELAKAELETFLEKPVKLINNMAFCETKKKDFSRLAMTNYAGKLIGKSKTIYNLKKIDYEKHFNKDYYLTTINASIDRGKIADIIWNSLKKPKTNMKNPKTNYVLIKYKDTYFMTVKKWENTEKFSERKAHLRPAHHTASLSPKLARALVNLTGIKKGKILDPFCGSGGILIEAGMMGLKVEGYDIDEKVLKKARINLRHYKVKGFVLQKKDALKMPKISYIASDLPYGQSTLMEKDLYDDFLRVLKQKLQKRAVLVFNHKTDYKKLLRKHKLKLVKEFEWYVHKSMTRKIIVVEKI